MGARCPSRTRPASVTVPQGGPPPAPEDAACDLTEEEAPGAPLVHGDMEGAWNEDLLEAARIGRAASSGIDWTRTEGAALHAAVEAGQDALLRRGATSEEAVAAIHAAGAESIGPKFFGASIGCILWEDTAASLIAESEVVGNRTARFGTSEERATLAEIAAEVSGLTRGERTDGACSDQLSAVICRRRVQ